MTTPHYTGEEEASYHNPHAVESSGWMSWRGLRLNIKYNHGPPLPSPPLSSPLPYDLILFGMAGQARPAHLFVHLKSQCPSSHA
mmetsp:Transcript_39639/g.64295  ORF Transcript_39639/g.64295 Transcript_39639/m.64295 type:complete len:84 (+) Transcript_39639:918-1169(+)